jgi:thiamine pyrophosphokinase
MTRFTLLLGGDLVRTPRLDAQIAGSRIIAADSGMRHASMLGVVPELWVGDFDSVSPELLARHADIPRRTYPPEKDLTDGEIAVVTAREEGAGRLLLAGAFGGERADHAFLHIAAAIRLFEDGMDIVLTSGNQEGTPLPHDRTVAFDYAPGTIFSVIGLTDLAGLTLTGVHWPLTDAEVPFGSSLTMSNRVSDHLEVTLQSGCAMLVAHLTASES